MFSKKYNVILTEGKYLKISKYSLAVVTNNILTYTNLKYVSSKKIHRFP